MTARTIPIPNTRWSVALVGPALVAAVMAAVAVIAFLPEPTRISGPALGTSDDFGLRHPGATIATGMTAGAPELGLADDFGLRLAGVAGSRSLTPADDYGIRVSVTRAESLTLADDYATRHGAAGSDTSILSEADDYGTRNGGPVRFGPPGR